jgi:hypothetical protein
MNARYTVVTPWIMKSYMDECVKDCKFDRDNWLMVDNSKVNLGIQRPVNMGIDKMVRDDTDWLVYMSATMRFAEPGGLDFIDHLAQHPDHAVIEAMGPTTQSIWGWHLIAFNRRTVEAVGRWDENFYPAYYDDIDYSVRFQRAYKTNETTFADSGVWTKMPIAACDAGAAHALHFGGIKINGEGLISYFTQKWGRHPDYPTEGRGYEHPFNNPDNPVQYWPAMNVGGIMGYWDQPLPYDLSEAL